MNINVGEILLNLWNSSGFAAIINGFTAEGGWQYLVMLAIACVLLYLAIVKKFEPLLLCGIAFGCLLSNLPGAGLYHQELWDAFMEEGNAAYHSYGAILREGGLLDFFYIGVKTSIYPCLIFMGVGAMTDFGPLLSNPKSLLLGAAAQLGVFAAYFGARLLGFTDPEAAAIGIIGGADGPTAIFLTTRLARSAGRYRRGGLFLHGADPHDSAPLHASADHPGAAQDQNGADPYRLQGGEDHLPHRGHHVRGAVAAGYCFPDRLPDAG